jgi:hypothetical protein
VLWWLQGKAWQFKGFPFKGADKGEMMETFSQLFGAFFYYSDEQVGARCSCWLGVAGAAG